MKKKSFFFVWMTELDGRMGTIYHHRLNKRVGWSCPINDHILESFKKETEVMKVTANKMSTRVRVGGKNLSIQIF